MVFSKYELVERNTHFFKYLTSTLYGKRCYANLESNSLKELPFNKTTEVLSKNL